jgi:hypothetical protein
MIRKQIKAYAIIATKNKVFIYCKSLIATLFQFKLYNAHAYPAKRNPKQKSATSGRTPETSIEYPVSNIEYRISSIE